MTKTRPAARRAPRPRKKEPVRSGARSAGLAGAGGDLRRAAKSLRDFALGFPATTEEFPWGERVAKVKGKVFVFLGADPVAGSGMGLSVKLPESRDEALDLPFTKPTGYGLGKAGWVTARFEPDEELPLDILKSWIAESYRAVAPKKLVEELDR